MVNLCIFQPKKEPAYTHNHKESDKMFEENKHITKIIAWLGLGVATSFMLIQ